MKIAGFYDESISNGLGWRAVLFVSGCPHHCPGCHNKEAQDFNYGEEFNEEEILKELVTRIMTSCYKLNVPLEVDYEIGNNWYDAK